MSTTRITTDRPDLSPVLGPLDEQQSEAVLAALAAADAQLMALLELLAEAELEFHSDGVVLEQSDSGQASIDGVVRESAGQLTFSAQLRPRNYFPTEHGVWQPGRAPLRMATDAWDVDGGVAVRFKTRVAGRPARIQQQVVELEERRFESAVAAAEAFAARCRELVEAASSRAPTVEAWRPPDEAASGPGQVTPAPSI